MLLFCDFPHIQAPWTNVCVVVLSPVPACFRQFEPKRTEIVINFDSINRSGMQNGANK